MSEIQLSIQDAQTHLSQYLSDLSDGDRILLCHRNQPIAEIRLLPKVKPKPRRLGLAVGDFVVEEHFFDPLSDEVLSSFEGNP